MEALGRLGGLSDLPIPLARKRLQTQRLMTAFRHPTSQRPLRTIKLVDRSVQAGIVSNEGPNSRAELEVSEFETQDLLLPNL